MYWSEKTDFAELKVYLIYKKQFLLFHNTLLILCDKEDGLVGVSL